MWEFFFCDWWRTREPFFPHNRTCFTYLPHWRSIVQKSSHSFPLTDFLVSSYFPLNNLSDCPAFIYILLPCNFYILSSKMNVRNRLGVLVGGTTISVFLYLFRDIQWIQGDLKIIGLSSAVYMHEPKLCSYPKGLLSHFYCRWNRNREKVV